MAIKIDNSITCKNKTYYYPGRPLSYIVIHYTTSTSSPAGRAKASVTNFRDGSRKASADFVVDDGNTVYQANPDIKNRACWAVGGSKYASCPRTGGGKFYKLATNKNCISIEMCSSKIDKSKAAYTAEAKDWYITDAVRKNTLELTVMLMKKYDIDIDHVIRHFDVVGKVCPSNMCLDNKNVYYNTTGNQQWDLFKKDLKDLYEGKDKEEEKDDKKEDTKTETPVSESKNETKTETTVVKKYCTVNANSGLNIRKSASTGSTILTTAPNKAKLEYLGTAGTKWYKVKYNGKTGYAYNQYLSKPSTTSSAATVTMKTTANLNLRSKASITGKILLVIHKNKAVTLIQKTTNTWYKVKYNGTTGYVSKKYLK